MHNPIIKAGSTAFTFHTNRQRNKKLNKTNTAETTKWSEYVNINIHMHAWMDVYRLNSRMCKQRRSVLGAPTRRTSDILAGCASNRAVVISPDALACLFMNPQVIICQHVSDIQGDVLCRDAAFSLRQSARP